MVHPHILSSLRFVNGTDGVYIVGSCRPNGAPRENPQLSEAAVLNCDGGGGS